MLDMSKRTEKDLEVVSVPFRLPRAVKEAFYEKLVVRPYGMKFQRWCESLCRATLHDEPEVRALLRRWENPNPHGWTSSWEAMVEEAWRRAEREAEETNDP